jgi:hypothetical protein
MMSGNELKEISKDQRKTLSKLFQGYQWNYLPDAILDGYMGRALADDENNPQVAVLEAPSIHLGILGGDSSHPSAGKYIDHLAKFTALLWASEDWEELIENVHDGKLIKMPRYAFTSEKLDIEHLRKLRGQLPDGYRLEQMDLKLAQQLAAERSGFSADHMLNFDSPLDFIKRGFGFCILAEREIVSVATTFAVCNKGIEIQINTRKKHRGKGLATVVAAQLLIHSLENNLDPNWDAENEISAGLALKLGYTPQGTYPIYTYTGSRIMAIIGQAGLKIKEWAKE